MRKLSLTGLVVLAATFAPQIHAQGIGCAAVPLVMPLNAAALAPVSAELVSITEQMAISGGVLTRANDPSQSVEQVLLRMQVESCRNVARSAPALPGVDPNDPATYKPRTEFDNAPWRFDMTQNGKRMTADEFSAWMESRGIRVSQGVPRTAETIRAEQEAAQQQQTPPRP